MLPFGVTIPATVPQRSEIPKGLMNYPVFVGGTHEEKTQCILKGKTEARHALNIIAARAISEVSAALIIKTR